MRSDAWKGLCAVHIAEKQAQEYRKRRDARVAAAVAAMQAEAVEEDSESEEEELGGQGGGDLGDANDMHFVQNASQNTPFTSSQALRELSPREYDEVDAPASQEDYVDDVEDLSTTAPSSAPSTPVYLWQGPWDPRMGTNRSVREQQEYDAGRDMLHGLDFDSRMAQLDADAAE